MANEPSSLAPVDEAKSVFRKLAKGPDSQADQPSQQEETDQITADLHKMEVVVDADPTLTGGIPVLRAKLAQVEAHLSVALDMTNAARSRVQKAKSRWRDLQLGLRMATDLLVATDPEVRGGRNISDRNAIASIKLQNEHQMVREAEGAKMHAEMLLQNISAKLDHLKDIRRHLRGHLRDLTEHAPVGIPPRYPLPQPGGNHASRVKGPEVDPEDLLRS